MKKDKHKAKTISFRADEITASALENAMEITGEDKTQIIIDCIKRGLPSVVRSIVERRKLELEKLQAFSDLLSSEKKPGTKK